jgi:hypothetical protein
MASEHPAVIVSGLHGLTYLTDRDEPGIFIAAGSVFDASRFYVLARAALAGCANLVPGHTLHDDERGLRITIPDPEPMTPEQRRETIERLEAHLASVLPALGS